MNVGVRVVRGWGGVVRGIVRPTRCGSLRLGIVSAIGVVRRLLRLLEISGMITFKVHAGTYLWVMVVLRYVWLVGLIDWCWWMVSLVPSVRRNVCVCFGPIAGIFPLERWWRTLRVEARRILLIIRVVRGGHPE